MTSATPTTLLTISHLAGLGDGVAMHEGKPIFVPYVCAGEQVRVSFKGDGNVVLEDIVESAKERIPPACIHYTHCGGCRLQHLDKASYHAFKQTQWMQPLKALGVENWPVQPMFQSSAHARRRAEFAVQIYKGEVRLGFYKPRSHELVDIQQCPVVVVQIEALLPALRTLIASLKKPSAILSVHVTQALNGMDLLLKIMQPLTAQDVQKVQTWAAEYAIVRVAIQQESQTPHIMVNGAVTVDMGGIEADLPLGAFLQATHITQQAMSHFVLEHVGNAKQVVDIYSGLGTFTLPLLKAGKQVSAYEGEPHMVAALHNAARKAGFESHVKVETRDLYKQPLPADRLNYFDAVVINPPRNGAEPQVKQIAQSAVKRVIMVSCNPTTFARDAGWLLKAGYQVKSLLPVDQFFWSAHLELLAVFERGLSE